MVWERRGRGSPGLGCGSEDGIQRGVESATADLARLGEALAQLQVIAGARGQVGRDEEQQLLRQVVGERGLKRSVMPPKHGTRIYMAKLRSEIFGWLVESAGVPYSIREATPLRSH